MRMICVIAVVLLAACSSQLPQTETYLLRSEVAPGAATPIISSGIALGNILVATYIDQPGLVLETGDGTVHAARHHVWAEPLQLSLRRYLATQISGASGRDVAAQAGSATKTQINVSVDQLHGENGGALLVAYWDVETAQGNNTFRFSEQQALSGDGYDALVAAEEALLKRLADAIAASLPPAADAAAAP